MKYKTGDRRIHTFYDPEQPLDDGVYIFQGHDVTEEYSETTGEWFTVEIGPRCIVTVTVQGDSRTEEREIGWPDEVEVLITQSNQAKA